MRIASYFPDLRIVGRNDGGPLFHTEILRRIFGRQNVVHLFPHGDLSHHGKFDLHYMVDWGEDALGFENFEIPSPSVYITSDTHLGYAYRLARARRMDFTFCNQQKAQQDFIRDGIPADRCFWLPHAFDPMAYSPGVWNDAKNAWDTDAAPMKKYDVCFIGNLNDENRVCHLDKLFKAFPNFYWGNQRFHLAAEKFNQSRIVFNVSSRGELNMRQFEGMGAGAFMLSDRIAEDQDVFTAGVHYAAYDDINDMIEKGKYYLAHPEEMDKIAAAGHQEAVANHTYRARVLAVLEKIGVALPELIPA